MVTKPQILTVTLDTNHFMRLIAFIFTLLFSCSLSAQDKDKTEILRILDNQITHWNQGNINRFMEGYWVSDSLMFIGKSGVTYGYQNTLNNYKKNYSDTAKMGKLKFDLLEVKRISGDAFFVVGKWHLKRSVGDVGGHYTLLFRKINGKWCIVADHSS
jgi:ketosteroid isomerase-like protein